MRLGYELGYLDRVTKPSDLRNPDHCPPEIMSDIERFYIRALGIPDTIKQQQARKVFSIIEKLSFSSVLDIGCAQGYYAVRIASKYPQVEVKGIDVNEEKLAMASLIKKKFGLRNVTFEKIDITKAQVFQKYDLVLLLQVIEHLKDDRATLIKIRELITKNGNLIITGPNVESPMINWEKRYLSIDGHIRDGYSMKQISNILADVGFRIKQIQTLSTTVGQFVEKFETYAKLNLPLFIFALLYPFLNSLTYLDDYINISNTANGSGFLIVASAY
ncbi:MAG: methyltransferase domain-containing protein [Candidatus Jordarchaeaceae archaeon]